MATFPSSTPGLRGSRIHRTVLWVSFQQDTETWISAHVVTKTDDTQTNEQI